MNNKRIVTELLTFVILMTSVPIYATAATDGAWEKSYYDLFAEDSGIDPEIEYALADINGDGTPEAFLAQMGTGGTYDIYLNPCGFSLVLSNQPHGFGI